MSVSKSRNALTFGWNLTLEIARGLLSRIRKGRSRRKRRRLCVILSSAGRINDKLNGFQWQVRYRKTCVISIQKKSMDFGLIDFFLLIFPNLVLIVLGICIASLPSPCYAWFCWRSWRMSQDSICKVCVVFSSFFFFFFVDVVKLMLVFMLFFFF